MAGSPSVSSLPPARVSQRLFMAIYWGGTAFSLTFVMMRVGIRLKTYKRLYWDDFFVVAAWILLCVSSVLWQLYSDYMYQNYAVVSRHIWPPPPGFFENMQIYLRSSVAVFLSFYCTLWFIKISFLIFFGRLGSRIRSQQIHRWLVFGFTIATGVVAVGIQEYNCLTGSVSHIIGYCASHGYARRIRGILIANMVLDVVSDIAIMTIPIALLWSVRVDLRKKMLLMGIFSLTVLIIVFAIVRVVVIVDLTWLPDQTWLYMWSAIEQTVAIVVACLASFRTLFTSKSESDSRLGGTSSTKASSFMRPLISFKNSVSTMVRSRSETTNSDFTRSDVLYPSANPSSHSSLPDDREKPAFGAIYVSRGFSKSVHMENHSC